MEEDHLHCKALWFKLGPRCMPHWSDLAAIDLTSKININSSQLACLLILLTISSGSTVIYWSSRQTSKLSTSDDSLTVWAAVDAQLTDWLVRVCVIARSLVQISEFFLAPKNNLFFSISWSSAAVFKSFLLFSLKLCLVFGFGVWCCWLQVPRCSPRHACLPTLSASFSVVTQALCSFCSPFSSFSFFTVACSFFDRLWVWWRLWSTLQVNVRLNTLQSAGTCLDTRPTKLQQGHFTNVQCY